MRLVSRKPVDIHGGQHHGRLKIRGRETTIIKLCKIYDWKMFNKNFTNEKEICSTD